MNTLLATPVNTFPVYLAEVREICMFSILIATVVGIPNCDFNIWSLHGVDNLISIHLILFVIIFHS